MNKNLQNDYLNCRKLIDNLNKGYNEYLNVEVKLNENGNNIIINKIKNYVGQIDGVINYYLKKYLNLNYEPKVFINLQGEIDEIKSKLIKKINKINKNKDEVILNNINTILRLEEKVLSIKYEVNNFIYDIDLYNKVKNDIEFFDNKINILSLKIPKDIIYIVKKISNINKSFFSLAYYNNYEYENLEIIVNDANFQILEIYKEIKNYYPNISNNILANGIVNILKIINKNFNNLWVENKNN